MGDHMMNLTCTKKYADQTSTFEDVMQNVFIFFIGLYLKSRKFLRKKINLKIIFLSKPTIPLGPFVQFFLYTKMKTDSN